jgi:hypothetical protein
VIRRLFVCRWLLEFGGLNGLVIRNDMEIIEQLLLFPGFYLFYGMSSHKLVDCPVITCVS